VADRGTVLGGAGLAAGLAAIAIVLARGGGAESAREAEALRAEVRALEGRLDQSRKSAEDSAREAAKTAEALAALRSRVEGLGEAVTALGEARDGAPGAAAAARVGAPAGAEGKRKIDPADPALRIEFRNLRKKFFDEQASSEEQQRYWELSKAPGFLDALLAEQEAVVAKAPGDLEARMVLGDDYVSKLFTVPMGPEMGVWGGKAEGQWKDILRQDESHWQARFNLAFSWSQYPDFLNKAPDAIREFETLRRQQEGRSAEPRFAATYLQLRMLYVKQGNEPKAREALEEGLRRFPEDAELKKLKDSLEK
jgi:tetratricopeptide (TPR) repeat protein